MDLGKVAKVLSGELPGEKVQWEMASSDRRMKNFPGTRSSDTLDAAVLILFFYDENILKTMFIRRAVYDGVHSGQVSFPGGKREAADTSLIDTALREATEEAGISASNVKILGALTPLYIPVSNIEVTPIVGWHNGKPAFKLQEREVDKLIVAPVDYFRQPSALKSGIFPVRGEDMEIKYFDYNGEVIWGATAMIFNEMLEVLRLSESSAQE